MCVCVCVSVSVSVEQTSLVEQMANLARYKTLGTEWIDLHGMTLFNRRTIAEFANKSTEA